MNGAKKYILLVSILFIIIPLRSYAATGTILTTSGGNLSSGTYYLNSNITLTNNIVIPTGNNVTLNLNGYVLKGNGNGSVITNNGKLTIIDERPNTVQNGTLLERTYNKIIDSVSTTQTATNAIWKYDGTGSVVIKGGVITGGNVVATSNNTAVSNTTGGGGIHNLGILTIEGGTIAGCEAGNNHQAGAIYIGTDANLTMNGGKILYNWCGGHTAGVYVYGGTFILNSGDISYNTVGGTAGAVRVGGTVDDKGTFTMNDGILSYNRALGDNAQTGNGGGIYCENGDFTFNGGEISYNTANNRGGGIDIWNVGTFSMDGNCIVKGNSAGYLGGGISIAYYASFSDQLNLILSGSNIRIEENTAVFGGGVGVRNGTFKMTNGILQKNIATDVGGAVYLENGNSTIEGGTIQKSSATNGGAMYVTSGDVIVTSGRIIDNSASNEGGAMYVNDGNVTIGLESCKGENNSHSHPVLSNNEATNNGGGISIVGGEIKMYCGNFENNKCRKNQASNSVNQTGGVFNIWGGNLGIGIIVTETSVFNDYREDIYQVTYHAIYDGVNETMVMYITANELLTLPSAEEIANEKFTREDLPLLGWSTTQSSTQGYMLVGQKIPIPSNVDLYAVWGVKSYIVYIPEFIEIDEGKTGIITFSASISMFSDTDCINVILSDKRELVLADSDESLTYELIDEETEEIIEVDDCIVTFSNENLDEKNMLISIKENQQLYYSGSYTGLMTFTVEEGTL